MSSDTLMTDLTAAPTTDPSSIYRTRDELYADDMLIAALQGVDFFTWLDANPGSIDQIAAHFGFHSRPVDVMTTLFVARGLLERHESELRLTPQAREHLVRSSTWYLGPYFPKLSDRPIAQDLLEVLRTGQPANFASRKNQVDWHKAMETEGFAEEFTAAMDCRGRLLAQALAGNIDLGHGRRLLDIAGRLIRVRGGRCATAGQDRHCCRSDIDGRDDAQCRQGCAVQTVVRHAARQSTQQCPGSLVLACR